MNKFIMVIGIVGFCGIVNSSDHPLFDLDRLDSQNDDQFSTQNNDQLLNRSFAFPTTSQNEVVSNQMETPDTKTSPLENDREQIKVFDISPIAQMNSGNPSTNPSPNISPKHKANRSGNRSVSRRAALSVSPIIPVENLSPSEYIQSLNSRIVHRAADSLVSYAHLLSPIGSDLDQGRFHGIEGSVILTVTSAVTNVHLSQDEELYSIKIVDTTYPHNKKTLKDFGAYRIKGIGRKNNLVTNKMSYQVGRSDESGFIPLNEVEFSSINQAIKALLIHK